MVFSNQPVRKITIFYDIFNVSFLRFYEIRKSTDVGMK